MFTKLMYREQIDVKIPTPTKGDGDTRVTVYAPSVGFTGDMPSEFAGKIAVAVPKGYRIAVDERDGEVVLTVKKIIAGETAPPTRYKGEIIDALPPDPHTPYYLIGCYVGVMNGQETGRSYNITFVQGGAARKDDKYNAGHYGNWEDTAHAIRMHARKWGLDPIHIQYAIPDDGGR